MYSMGEVFPASSHLAVWFFNASPTPKEPVERRSFLQLELLASKPASAAVRRRRRTRVVVGREGGAGVAVGSMSR